MNLTNLWFSKRNLKSLATYTSFLWIGVGVYFLSKYTGFDPELATDLIWQCATGECLGTGSVEVIWEALVKNGMDPSLVWVLTTFWLIFLKKFTDTK